MGNHWFLTIVLSLLFVGALGQIKEALRNSWFVWAENRTNERNHRIESIKKQGEATERIRLMDHLERSVERSRNGLTEQEEQVERSRRTELRMLLGYALVEGRAEGPNMQTIASGAREPSEFLRRMREAISPESAPRPDLLLAAMRDIERQEAGQPVETSVQTDEDVLRGVRTEMDRLLATPRGERVSLTGFGSPLDGAYFGAPSIEHISLTSRVIPVQAVLPREATPNAHASDHHRTRRRAIRSASEAGEGPGPSPVREGPDRACFGD